MSQKCLAMKTLFHHKFVRNLLLILFVLVLPQTIFSQIEDNENPTYPAESEILKTAKKTVKAYEMGNWQVLRNNVQPDAVFYNLGNFENLNLEETIEYWKKGRDIATPVLSEEEAWLPVNIPTGPREGKWVLHWGRNTLSYPNGDTISFPYHVALRFQDNKVSEAHFYYDNNRIIRALGYDIQPPLKEKDEDNGL